jgi:hypothetical protein
MLFCLLLWCKYSIDIFGWRKELFFTKLLQTGLRLGNMATSTTRKEKEMSEHKEAIRKVLIEQVQLGNVEITFDGRTDSDDKLIPAGELDYDADCAIDRAHHGRCNLSTIIANALVLASEDEALVNNIATKGVYMSALCYLVDTSILRGVVNNALELFSDYELASIWKMHPDYDHLESLAEHEIGPKDEGFYER